MRNFLFSIILVIKVTITYQVYCTTPNNCNYPYLACVSGQCNYWSSSADCKSHGVRKNAVTISSKNICVQCSTNAGCKAGQSCVTTNMIYLCGSNCNSPTANCGAGSQCIWVSSQYYCLACEIDADCRNWSGNSGSTCSGGICSPAFLSCGQTSDCPYASSAECSGSVCSPCTSSSSCTHLSSTPLCSSGVCVQCMADTDCPSITAAHCSGNTCVKCTDSSQCSRFTVWKIIEG